MSETPTEDYEDAMGMAEETINDIFIVAKEILDKVGKDASKPKKMEALREAYGCISSLREYQKDEEMPKLIQQIDLKIEELKTLISDFETKHRVSMVIG